MTKLIFAASLLAIIAVAACSPTAAGPSAVPSVPPSVAPQPSVEPPPSEDPAPSDDPAPTDSPETPAPTPPARPAPDPADDPETPDPAIVEFTPEEGFLADGIQRGVMDCEPVRGADLPKKAVAGIECTGQDWFVARVGYYLFENDDEMLAHYVTRMEAEGVTLDEGSCFDGEGDGQYIPGEEEVMSRQGCFITAQGVANYRLLLPGAHVYIGIVGHNIDTIELQDFAFKGNRDTPGFPTLWGNPGA